MRKSDVKDLITSLQFLGPSSPVIPLEKSVYLQRSPFTDFLLKTTSPSINIAELYHANSKLSKLTDFETTKMAADSLKERYFKSPWVVEEWLKKNKAGKSAYRSAETLPDGLSILSSRLDAKSELLYAVDIAILVLNNERSADLYRYDICSKWLIPMRTISLHEVKKLQQNIFELWPHSHTAGRNTMAIVFFIGAFWRNMLIYGPRGYRNTLIEAGRLAQYLSEQAEKEGLKALISENFFDTETDAFLDLDGIENSAVAMALIWRPTK